MTRFLEILISLAIVAVLMLVVALVLPSSRHLSESVETNRKLTIVYDTLNSLRRFDDWNPLVLRDSDMKVSLSGPESGVGARLDYSSDEENLGEGSWEITANEDKRSVTYKIVNPQRGSDKVTTYTLEPTGRNGRNVKITQTYDVDYGWNLLGRYAGMYVSRHVGDDMKLGLRRLSDMLATVPNYDYSLLPVQPKAVEVAVENVLFVPSTVDRNADVVRGQINTNLKWIKKVMESNGLEPAGPLRIITNEYGAENYAFEVAQPVRKIGTGPEDADDSADADEEGGNDDATASDAAAESEDEAKTEVAANAPALPAVDAPVIEVTIDPANGNPVEFRRSEAGQAVMVPFTGHMAGLSNLRAGLRAWAMTRGYVPTGRPYEAWKSGVADSFTDKGEFDVYWPVKPRE